LRRRRWGVEEKEELKKEERGGKVEDCIKVK
jgi:hypothetical protein